MTDRDTKIRTAKTKSVETLARDRAARKAKKKSAESLRFFWDEWREALWRRFGKQLHVVPWGPAEKSLLRKMLKEDGMDADKLVKMFASFVEWWVSTSKVGLPGIRYLWAVRETIRANVEGVVRSKADKMREAEFPREEIDSAGLPDVGW